MALMYLTIDMSFCNVIMPNDLQKCTVYLPLVIIRVYPDIKEKNT